MNLFPEINPLHARRSGISVVEVLSAMVVALIGVFGVMIMIPFSVQQAQSGLDRDEAATVGRNAFEQFEIEGFRYVELRPNPLTNTECLMSRIADPSPIHPSLPGVVVGPNPGVAVIDPLSRTGNDVPLFCEFNTFNLLDINRKPFTQPMARQMFRSTDDLQFESAVDELSPPRQIFDLVTTDDARRQSLGRLSWNAVLSPVKADYSSTPTGGTPGLMFRMHVLVHKDRDLDRDGILVDYPQAEVVVDPGAGGEIYGGGTIRVAWNQAGPIINEAKKVRRDDWVMLANKKNTEAGYQDQVAFYRVTGVDDTGNILTLDGSDFTLRQGTKLYHLVVSRNGKRSGQVINVYERTMQWEQKSNWN